LLAENTPVLSEDGRGTKGGKTYIYIYIYIYIYMLYIFLELKEGTI